MDAKARPRMARQKFYIEIRYFLTNQRKTSS
nr:MAG TPA: hypothetical protein [Caudoviricetes sp.]